MSKPIPLHYGHYYHIYNRGNNRGNVFVEERNYRHFLSLLDYHTTPMADIFAYCLMRNHFHLLVRVVTVAEQEEAWMEAGNQKPFKPRNPSQSFGNLFNAYTKAMNWAFNRTGSLFEKPFKRVEVTSDAYFTCLIAYIHRNPQKHGFVDDFRDWPFSSYNTHLSRKATRLKREQVLEWFEGVNEFTAFHEVEVDQGRIAPLVQDDFD